MNRLARRGTTGLTALALTTAGLALGAGTTPAQAAHAAEVVVTDATFTWDLNKEATSGAFAPGTWNLMSAGKIGDPGAGGASLTTASNGATWSTGAPAGWSSSAGDVTVEDLRAGGAYAPATFAGTRTNSAGSNANTSGVTGETRLSFGAGTGAVDPETGTASIAWDGDATLLAYSGMTFFYLSDPELTVTADGEGEVTATVGGYATSMDDPTAWTKLPDEEVTIASLSDVDVTADGIITTPDYLGVPYTASASSSPQATTGATYGSFPQSFVDFQQAVGQGPYWYSTGGSADVRKRATPISVVFGAEPEPAPPTVTVSDTDLLPSGAQTVTVEGSGFDPAGVRGTRPPLAGKSGGVYVAFGKYADTWRPSASAPSTGRKNTSVSWAVLADDMAAIGGAAGGATELRPDGTFTATLVVDKEAVDAAATDPSLVNYGIYTYPGSGAVNAAYETATPVTFTKATPTLTVTAPARKFGQVARATVRVASEGAASGTVSLTRGRTTVGTADLVNGRASFPLGRLGAGSYGLRASFSGNDTTSAASTRSTLRVAKAATVSRIRVTAVPRPGRKGRALVTVTSPTATPNGAVKVHLRTAQGRLVRTLTGRLNAAGKVAVVLPARPKGRYRLVAVFSGGPNVARSTRTTSFVVR